MEKAIRLFSSSSARERLLPAVDHAFAFFLFFFFFISELKLPSLLNVQRKLLKDLK